jgi:hypothetical protein
MGAGDYSLHHCGFENRRSYDLALQFVTRGYKPATATSNVAAASNRYTRRRGVEVIPHDNSKPCATFDALCDKNEGAIEAKRLNAELLWVPVTYDYSNTATV